MSSNRLIHETSPYLLQHAHNPVDWYPWGEEALERARTEQKPILVSIGYSACHWCHVMERESFESAEVAAIMNEHFVNIKIDREERPDLDHLYMDAVQAMTGSGGWPLNVFLTPELKPFYGGTYFPPQRAHQRPSWIEVLYGVAQAFYEKRSDVEAQAEQLKAHLQNANAFGTKQESDLPDRESLHLLRNNILQQADREEGGFGRAPKFPQTLTIRALLAWGVYQKDEQALAQARLSLNKMCAGGIYDQVGGGFARYSVDNEWLVPHFEKMLYDNALLLQALAEGFQVFRLPRYREVVEQTIGFLLREMKSPTGGFYAALDADSEGVEGKFYVWSAPEFEAIVRATLQEKQLPEQWAPLASEWFGVSASGNWEGENILNQTVALEEQKGWMKKNQLDPADWQNFLNQLTQNLLHQRGSRVRPGLDDKILLGWNGLLLQAISTCAWVFNRPDWRLEAEQLAGFLRKTFTAGSSDPLETKKSSEIPTLIQKTDVQVAAKTTAEQTEIHRKYWHTYKNGQARIPAFLDDLTSWAQGLLQLYRLTGTLEYLSEAEELVTEVLHQFSDEQEVLCYYTAADQTDVLVRKKEIYDGATPSGNAQLCGVLSKLGILLGKRDWQNRAHLMLKTVGATVTRYPTSFGEWALHLQTEVIGPREIAIVGVGAQKLGEEIGRYFIPFSVVQWYEEGNEGEKDDENGENIPREKTISRTPAPFSSGRYPLLEGRILQKRAKIYLCRNYSCEKPVETLEELLQMIDSE